MKNPDRDVTLDNRPCHGRIESETCCLPAKRNCSVNGKNKLYKCMLPFGILEVLCCITGVLASLWGLQAKNFPFAYTDSAELLAGSNVLLDSDNYNMFTGDYNTFYEKTVAKNTSLVWKTNMAQAYTMLDRDLVQNWDVSDAAMSSQTYWRNSTQSQAQFDQLRSNNATYNSFEDIIIYSHFCMCKGWYPATGMLDKKTCTAAGDYCKPFAGAGLAFVDLPAQGISVVGSVVGNTMTYPAFFTLVAVIARVVYVYWRPRHLMMPGTQWLTGFWTFITCYMLMNEGQKIGVALPTTESLGQYHVKTMATRGALPGGNFYTLGGGVAQAASDGEGPMVNQFLAHGKKLQIVGGVAMLLNLSLLFLSEYAYCTDCTHFAYLQDNLSLIRKKSARRVAKRNSAVLSVKQL